MASAWIDVSVPLKTGMVHWPSDPAVEVTQPRSLDRGDSCTMSFLRVERRGRGPVEGGEAAPHLLPPVRRRHRRPRPAGLRQTPIPAIVNTDSGGS